MKNVLRWIFIVVISGIVVVECTDPEIWQAVKESDERKYRRSK